MIKLRRRQLLLAGLATGVAATGTQKYLQSRTEHQQQAALEALARSKYQQRDISSILKATFEADAEKINRGLEIQSSLNLVPPKIPYDRNMSKLLILCSKLGTQQYLKGKIDPTYNGAIKSLPAYTNKLDSYTRILAIKGLEEQEIAETVEVDTPASSQSAEQDPIGRNLDMTGDAIANTVKHVVKLKNRVPVYFGFALTSKNSNIIVFRGTQRTSEWLRNVLAFQFDYLDQASAQSYGKIHSGFADVYKEIAEPTIEIAQQLNPSLPCYITGHSLGSALAVIAALDIALKIPSLKAQIRLYTYAGPRVGDPVFAKTHNRLIPNSYRIVNLADSIPLTPPTIFRNDIYVDVGQVWSFLTYHGDVLPNHVVDTYREAVNREVETNKPPSSTK